MTEVGFAPLSTKHRIGLVALIVAILGFGVLVELRGAFQASRKTDAGVFFRAAWAVRAGEDIYSVVDDNRWHYHYFPLFAIMMTPLADPPSGVDRSGFLPYPVSLGVWYMVNWVFLFAGMHILASALEETSFAPSVHNQSRYGRRWWALRIWPVLICVLPIGHSLGRGQVACLLTFLLCGMAAAMLRGRRLQSGFWLAATICLKIIPAYLLILPVWRRDRRMLIGCAGGLMLGLAVIPAVVIGPQRTIDSFKSVVGEILLPGLRTDTQGSRGRELTGVTSTSNFAPLVIIHNLIYPEHKTRPKEAAAAARIGHWIVAGLLTLGILYAAGRRGRTSCLAIPDPLPPPSERTSPGACLESNTAPGLNPYSDDARDDVMFLAALSIGMLIVSPVFHNHYFAQTVFPVLLLLASQWEKEAYPQVAMKFVGLFSFLIIAYLLVVLPNIPYVREFGLLLLAAFALLLTCAIELRRTRPAAAFSRQALLGER